MQISKLGTKVAHAILKSNNASLAKANTKPLFCEEYWAFAKNNRFIRNRNKTSVEFHGELNSINHHFYESPHPEHMDMPTMNSQLTPREIISQTDFEFKELKPTEKAVTAFRAIGEKPTFFSTYNLYKKASQVKAGETFQLRGYSYFTSDKNYANIYLTNNKGILYEIEFPANSRISRTGIFGSKDEITTPRGAEFLCTGTEHIKNADADYILVKGRYIQPKDFLNRQT
ncbi:hypothetical protein J6E39_04695 [bacterium]|nr:hypothetical protein [bacterium]